jgi:hypothetical protein
MEAVKISDTRTTATRILVFLCVLRALCGEKVFWTKQKVFALAKTFGTEGSLEEASN